MDEQGQRRDVEGQALGLARPVQEGPAQPAELLDGLVQRPDGCQHRAVGDPELLGPVERVSRRESGGALDEVQEPLPELARGVLAVPVERRGERRVVPVGGRRLLLPELRLRAHLGAHRALGVVVGVALGDAPRPRRPPSAGLTAHRCESTASPMGRSRSRWCIAGDPLCEMWSCLATSWESSRCGGSRRDGAERR